MEEGAEKTENIQEKKIEAKATEEKKDKYIEIEKPGWYNKNYKKLFFLSIILLVIFFVFLGFFYSQHGDIMYKDVSLTGGTVITVYTKESINLQELENSLSGKLEDISVRKLEDITTRKQVAIVVETKSDSKIAKKALEDHLGYKLDDSNSSIEISGASLSESFYRQMITALAIAFIIMAIVVFIIFRNFVPSVAVILAAVMDIVGALTIANLFGFHISTAGIAAFLMLVGYSVDTDVMLTTKVIKRRGEGLLNSRIKNAAKTGLTMTFTSLAAVLIGYFIAQSSVLKQIFFILSAGLFIDLISTWLGNASILKWWCEKKNIS